MALDRSGLLFKEEQPWPWYVFPSFLEVLAENTGSSCFGWKALCSMQMPAPQPGFARASRDCRLGHAEVERLQEWVEEQDADMAYT